MLIGSRHKRYMGRECNEKRIVISAYRYDVHGRVLSGFSFGLNAKEAYQALPAAEGGYD
ncbi:hypothetical protein [Paenibacillus cellulositrophicus]|uniref:hypothetical protein n=1 Tax=Paenibacillus cellulositrophicus TaxID=562959 RepID=UPI003D970461